MQNKYKCRGIMKWAPFASLVGYSELVSEELVKRHHQTKPILSDDQKEEINQSLIYLKQHGGKLMLKYYDKNIIKILPCEFKDIKDGKLFINNNLAISLYDIIYIHIVY